MEYKTSGTCSSNIHIETSEKDGRKIVENVVFTGGCNGNLQGISKLIKGMYIEDVISRLEGIRCGYKNTSCPDQLAQALKQLI